MTCGIVESINVSDGGVPKLPVDQVSVTPDGLEGDRQEDLKQHGGPERAVSLFSLERIQALQAEGHSIQPGSTGENLTVSGLDWDGIGPGTVLEVGEVRLEVTRHTPPCYKISESFAEGAFKRISQKEHPGWSRVCCRVLKTGVIKRGDTVHITRMQPSQDG